MCLGSQARTYSVVRRVESKLIVAFDTLGIYFCLPTQRCAYVIAKFAMQYLFSSTSVLKPFGSSSMSLWKVSGLQAAFGSIQQSVGAHSMKKLCIKGHNTCSLATTVELKFVVLSVSLTCYPYCNF